MDWLLILALATIIGLAFVHAPRDASGARPLLTARNIVLALIFIYIVFPAALIGLDKGSFTWAPSFGTAGALRMVLGLTIGATLAFLYGHFLFRFIELRRHPKPARLGKAPTRVFDTPLIVPIALIVIGLAIKAYVIVSSGGLTQLILRLSTATQAAAGLEDLDASTVGLRSLSSIAEVGATWLAIRSFRDKRHSVLAVVTLIAILGISYASMGKRLGLLLPVFAVLVGWSHYRKRITVRSAPLLLVAVLGGGMVSLIFRIFAPASAANVTIDLNAVDYAGGSIWRFYFYSLEFSTAEMIAVATQAAREISGLFGGPWEAFVTTNLVPFTYAVPRVIWSEKPEMLYDISYGVSTILNGNNLEDSTVGYASTIVGTSYVIAGLIGTLAVMLLFGWFSAQVDTALARSAWSIPQVMIYAFLLVLSFHFFRQGTLGWTFIVSVVQQLGFLLGLLVLCLARQQVSLPPKDVHAATGKTEMVQK